MGRNRNPKPKATTESNAIDEPPPPNEEIGADHQALLDLFRKYGKELDDKHDRYERIVKISRDITIESKRIIFLLHNVDKR